MRLDKIDSSHFDWLKWKAGSFADLVGFPCRYEHITSPQGKETLQRLAVGYCDGDALPCRPKSDCVGLMCWTLTEGHFWFHITKQEFKEVFNPS
jgi:hypothetical protein